MLFKDKMLDGIYLIANFVCVALVTAMMKFFKISTDNPQDFPAKELTVVVIFSFVVSLVSLVLQGRARQKKLDTNILFRQLIATTFDLSVTFALFRMLGMSAASVNGSLMLGLFNAGSLFSFTGMVRDSYTLYDPEDPRDIAPSVLIGSALSLCFLTMTLKNATYADRVIRGFIIAMMVFLLTIGQQTNISDPMKTQLHSESSTKSLSTGETIIIIFMSLLAFFLGSIGIMSLALRNNRVQPSTKQDLSKEQMQGLLKMLQTST